VSCSPGTVCSSLTQPCEQLLREVELGGLGEVGDVAGVDDQRRLLGHRVDEIDRPAERSGDIGIGVLGESDVGVAHLQEQRLAERGEALLVVSGTGEIDRRECPAGEDEQRPRGAVRHTLQRAATRQVVRCLVRHDRLRVGVQEPYRRPVPLIPAQFRPGCRELE